MAAVSFFISINKVPHIAITAQVVWGPVSCMFSKQADTGQVRDREKLCSSDIVILLGPTDLLFSSSFYNARLACKCDRPVFDQTHLVN